MSLYRSAVQSRRFEGITPEAAFLKARLPILKVGVSLFHCVTVSLCRVSRG